MNISAYSCRIRASKFGRAVNILSSLPLNVRPEQLEVPKSESWDCFALSPE